MRLAGRRCAGLLGYYVGAFGLDELHFAGLGGFDGFAGFDGFDGLDGVGRDGRLWKEA